MSNPFAITFGRTPAQYIPRISQRETVIQDFNSGMPTTQAYAIIGVRGSGKTVLLSEISRKIGNDWSVVDLNAQGDLMTSLASQLYADRKNHKLFVQAKFDFSFMGIGVHLEKAVPAYDAQTAITLMLQEVKKKNRKILVTIDEVSNTENMRAFAGMFQILIRNDLPIFLVMAGTPENIYGLINDKLSTFLYRTPRIEMTPLNYESMSNSYKKTLKVDETTALHLAHLTKGYSFAYQVLGYVCWGNEIDIESETFTSVMGDFDYYLQELSYVKIWDEMSPTDKKVAIAIAEGNITSTKVQESIGMDPKKYGVYRDRLKKKGLIDASIRGKIIFALPRFDRFILSQPAEFDD